MTLVIYFSINSVLMSLPVSVTMQKPGTAPKNYYNISFNIRIKTQDRTSQKINV